MKPVIVAAMLCVAFAMPAAAQDTPAAAPATAPVATPPAPPTGVANIYDRTLGDGWQNWSWAKAELSVVLPGTQRTPIRVTAGPYQALFLHHAPFDTTPYKNLSMLIQGVGGGGQKVRIVTIVGGKPVDDKARLVTLPPSGWMKVDVPLTVIGADAKQIEGFWVQNATDQPLPPFYVTEVALR